MGLRDLADAWISLPSTPRAWQKLWKVSLEGGAPFSSEERYCQQLGLRSLMRWVGLGPKPFRPYTPAEGSKEEELGDVGRILD